MNKKSVFMLFFIFKRGLIPQEKRRLLSKEFSMKKEGHPPYQDILFVDTATGHKFVCGSTLQPKETDTYEGEKYPVYKVPISSASHPFFTGSQQFVDSEGRVDKFKKRYSRKPQAEKQAQNKEQEDQGKKKPAAKKTVVRKTATKKTPPKE